MPEEIYAEYPKMLYAHPVDKTKEHKTLVVATPDEESAAVANGYKVEPHVPVAPEDQQFEETIYEVATPEPVADIPQVTEETV